MPVIDEMSLLIEQPNYPGMEKLVDLVHDGKALVHRCSNISTFNFLKKRQCTKELIDLDDSLRRHFTIIQPGRHDFSNTMGNLPSIRELRLKSEADFDKVNEKTIVELEGELNDAGSSSSTSIRELRLKSEADFDKDNEKAIVELEEGLNDAGSSSSTLIRELRLKSEADFDKDNEKAIVELEEGLNDAGSSSSSSSMSMVVVPVYSSRISPKGKFNFRQFSIQSWQKGKILGSGSFGTVYEGYTDNGLYCAVKEVSLLDKGSHGQQSILQLEQEISLLSQLEHENIVQYLGTAKDEDRLYIFLELVATGSLLSLYRNYTIRDSQASSYTRQILNGLKYLHEKNWVHRDIKCANILVDASGFVKLADFGLAKATKADDIKSCKGTAFWMAPEVVNSYEKGYGIAADIWSLGCTVLEMLTRQHPYSNLEWMQAACSIGQGELPLFPNSLSPDARDFIHKCLQVNPDNRPTAFQLLNHPFVKR